MTINLVHLTIDEVARNSYGKLLAYLSSRFRDIQACEEALAEAFIMATQNWSNEEIPDQPEAWILTVAKNKLIDGSRKNKKGSALLETLNLINEERSESSLSSNQNEFTIYDDRLKLLFACCHPSIDETVRTPLMLQTILGLDSKAIASAFLTSPDAMMKKLVRAKQKIKLAGISFAIPELDQLPEQLDYVLQAIYVIYGKSWDSLGSADSELKNLDGEAIYLAELLVQLLPLEAEPKGLLAFMLFCESRKNARRSKDNLFIPLDEQDTNIWDQNLIEKAEKLLQQAFMAKKIGRFQIEAAIQSAHVYRIWYKINNWKEILNLYNGLVSIAPTVAAFVNRAYVIAEYNDAALGLAQLEEIPHEYIKSYQPFWVLKATLLQKVNNITEADKAYSIAIGLTQDESIRLFLQKKKKAVR